MKKLSSKGFTLIELLAVIVIMGILMMIAIPAISRAITNARKDTFATTAKKYLDAVRNEVFADNVVCGEGIEKGEGTVASAMPNAAAYYLVINTVDKDGDASKLLESGGKSPFGSAELKGYVIWVKTLNTTKYSIALVDSGKHGFTDHLEENGLKRRNVHASLTDDIDITKAPLVEVSKAIGDKAATKCILAE